jgi:hypothetical protein
LSQILRPTHDMRTYTPHMIIQPFGWFYPLLPDLLAQEKTEVSIQVKKDGKVVKDTTYLSFEDAKEAKHVLKMVDVMSGWMSTWKDVHYNYTMTSCRRRVTVKGHDLYLPEDGNKTEIKEIQRRFAGLGE